MKAREILSILIILSSTFWVKGQDIDSLKARSSTPEQDFLNKLVSLKKLKNEPKKIGSYYIDDNWNTGRVVLHDDQVIQNYTFRYNIKNKWLEFQFGTQVKVCPFYRVLNFEWTTANGEVLRKFVNCKGFTSKNESPLGFFEVLHDEGDRYKLFSKTTFTILNPTYNPVLDVGDKEERISKRDRYYLVDGTQIIMVEKNKDANLKFFGERANEVKALMKKNKLKFGSQKDLLQLMDLLRDF